MATRKVRNEAGKVITVKICDRCGQEAESSGRTSGLCRDCRYVLRLDKTELELWLAVA